MGDEGEWQHLYCLLPQLMPKWFREDFIYAKSYQSTALVKWKSIGGVQGQVGQKRRCTQAIEGFECQDKMSGRDFGDEVQKNKERSVWRQLVTHVEKITGPLHIA